MILYQTFLVLIILGSITAIDSKKNTNTVNVCFTILTCIPVILLFLSLML